MNVQTIFVLAVVAAIFVVIILNAIHNKRQGKASCSCGSCGGGCSGCPMSGECGK